MSRLFVGDSSEVYDVMPKVLAQIINTYCLPCVNKTNEGLNCHTIYGLKHGPCAEWNGYAIHWKTYDYGKMLDADDSLDVKYHMDRNDDTKEYDVLNYVEVYNGSRGIFKYRCRMRGGKRCIYVDEHKPDGHTNYVYNIPDIKNGST